MTKVIRLAVAVAATVTSLSSYGMSDTYKYCALHGYYSASANQFLGSLVIHKRIKTVPNDNDATCLALFKQGRDTHDRMQTANNVPSQADMEIITIVAIFEAAIYDAVLKAAGM